MFCDFWFFKIFSSFVFLCKMKVPYNKRHFEFWHEGAVVKPPQREYCCFLTLVQCNINAPKMSITDNLLLTKSNICSIMDLGGRTKEGVGEVEEKFSDLINEECVAGYKKDIIDLVNEIDNVSILKFVFNMIFSIKKKWGV